MKRILNILSILWISGHSYAQTLNATTTENYVYTKTCLDGDCIKKTEAIQYFDGLGRTKQTVGIKATPSGRDIVNYIEYDEFGRLAKEYLPIPQNSTQNGAFYSNPLANAPSVFGQEKIYSEKKFENSPLSRVDKITPLGNDWALHPVQMAYSANIAGEVKKFTVINSWVNEATSSQLIENGTYSANQLMKISSTDSDGNTTTEFKNTAGQTLLVRKNDGTQNVDTYYVYNDFGMQIFVITPLAATTTVDQNALDNLCYQYRYDNLGRLVEKKLPGKGWEYMVYNKADQLILTQDTALKEKGQWFFTKYDQFGRTVYTGITNNAASRVSIQNSANANANLYETRTATAGFTLNSMPVYYTKLSTPTGVTQVLSVNYYDTYPVGSPAVTNVFSQPLLTDDPAQERTTKGLPTASFVKNIEDDNWTKNFIWYDTKGRNIGSRSNNHLGGYTVINNKLDFAGVVLQINTYHRRLGTDPEKAVVEKFTYDSQNRILTRTHQVGSNPLEYLSQNKYNELSQLESKKVGGIAAASPLQTVDYTYNIRGSLIKINDPVNLNGKLFGYELKYQNPDNSSYKRFNGNISEVDWKTSVDNVLKRYIYAYDPLNRLIAGYYQEPTTSVPVNHFYNEEIAYDPNGNITRLQRNMKGNNNSSEYIDNIYYTYSGNRLTSASDITQNFNGYPTGGNQIGYDNNGNMINQLDKGISSIQYNYLNLPKQITQNSKVINYYYRADGVKIKKSGPVGSNIDYLDGFQYTEGSIKFAQTSEGYFNFENNKYIYNYTDHLGNIRLSYYKNETGIEILEESNYYPFGLKHGIANPSVGNLNYNYKYNGKELQENGMYDYGARMYMPDLGRWGVTDPLAEAFRRFSPYHYGADNPVMFTDPDGMRNVPYDGGIISNVPEGSYWFAGMNGSFTPDYVENSGLGKRTGGGAPQTFGETQTYKDIMAYLNDPETNYFKEIDFTEFSSDKGGPGDKEKSQQKVTLSGKSKNFTGKFSISYDYEVKDGKTIVSDIKMHTNLNDKWSPLDSWSENVNGSMEEEPIYTVRGNYIFFETYGTLKLLDFSFSKNGVSGGFSIFEFPYKFTGYVNVNDPSNSNVNIKAIKP
ncbi:DUF6443 domain-containing protein [Chryseobacterium sp. HR92]|uniref:DUF6443 domain-containing protein n=1 Tax=Chryseobacterium sp. HR92 TaxID=3094839 RepID=UPI00388F11AA|nr:DUF6443 domain-containing protein [Chryseobacterium sp. HR92]